MKRTARWTIGLLAFALAIGACGKKAPTSPDLGLTSTEIDSLAYMLVVYSVRAVPSGLRDMAPGQGAHLLGTAAATDTLSYTLPCPVSGVGTIEGTYTRTDNDTGWVTDGDITETPANCVVRTAGHVFTLNGAPALQLTSHLVFVNHSLQSIDAGLTGGFTWERASGGYGNCSVDITVSSFDNSGQVLTTSGTVCGKDVGMSMPAG